MAEASRRSFDLKSWQGLTEVLKVARESNLEPSVYAEFRNLVLEYAQQKGTDAELKKKIDKIILSFDDDKENEENSKHDTAKERHGRRVIPSFMPKFTSVESIDESTLAPVAQPVVVQAPPPVTQAPVSIPVSISAPPPVPTFEPIPTAVPVPSPVVQAVPAPPPAYMRPAPGIEGRLKTIEEHRLRIMDIKRRVNSLVGNPITLIDNGNHIGRDYMSALLTALKATSPGTTLNAEDAMSALESSFEIVLNHISNPNGAGAPAPLPDLEPVTPAQEPVPQAPSVSIPVPVPVPVQVPPPVPVVVEEPLPPPPPVSKPVPPPPAPRPVPPPPVLEEKEETPHFHTLDEIPVVVGETAEEEKPTSGGYGGYAAIEDEVVAETTEEPPPKVSAPPSAGATHANADVDAQIKKLREQLKARSVSPPTRPPATQKRHSIIPSVVEMEENPLPEPETPHALSRDPKVPPPPKQIPHRDELSPRALTERPTSSLTGITLGTPQGELVSPDVTMALTELLHEWKIFASSGLFGMGPGGIEHPLYIKLSRLQMGEVLSGRFEDADMKVVHTIKDYIDAWRHEQGIAYNPTETFEHYLRRVAQRILKRQKGIVDL